MNLAGRSCPSCSTTVLIESGKSRVLQVILLLLSLTLVLVAISSYRQYGFDPVTFTLVVGWFLSIVVLIDLKFRSKLHVKKSTT